MSSSEFKPVPDDIPHDIALSHITIYRRSHSVFAGNAHVSLIDLGDGIGCFEFHSKMNVLGSEIVSFLIEELRPGSAAMQRFDGFILSTDAAHFSAGANLKQMLQWAQNQQWNNIRDFISDFQVMTQAIKFRQSRSLQRPRAFAWAAGARSVSTRHSAKRTWNSPRGW